MKFWEIKNTGTDEGEVLLYGEIRDEKPWWADGSFITPDDFLRDIKKLRHKSKVTVRLNSCGGDVFAATAIYTQLKSLTAHVTVIVDGVAASAATIIAMAADTIKIPANALMMIHNPAVVIWDVFEADELEKLRNSLVQCKTAVMEAYAAKTKLSIGELSGMMDDETWMTGREAVEKGFADEVLFEEFDQSNIKLSNNGRFMFVNSIGFDISGFKNNVKIQNLTVDGKANPSAVEDKRFEKEEGGQKPMDMNELIKDHPDLVRQIQESAKEEGVSEERSRLRDIEKIANTINPDILAKAKYETPMDAKTLAFENAVLEAGKGTQFRNDAKADTEESGVDDVGTEPGSPAVTDKKDNSERVKGLAAVLNKDKRRTQ